MNQFQVKINEVLETEILEFEHRPVISEFILHRGKTYVIKGVLHPTDIKTLTILFIESVK